jgi:hypothetical protein
MHSPTFNPRTVDQLIDFIVPSRFSPLCASRIYGEVIDFSSGTRCWLPLNSKQRNGEGLVAKKRSVPSIILPPQVITFFNLVKPDYFPKSASMITFSFFSSGTITESPSCTAGLVSSMIHCERCLGKLGQQQGYTSWLGCDEAFW